MSGPARRFLHVCYCCDADPSAAQLFVDGLAMRQTMASPIARSSGAILGIDCDVVNGADFLYDARGPRISPAIEVQHWVDPALVGEPFDDPTSVGIQAVGLSVPQLDAAEERLEGMGCTPLDAGPSPFGARWSSVRDPRGVTIDLVEDSSLPAGETRMRHLRITVTDLTTSVPWYEGLGFEVAGTVAMDRSDAVRLRLPDEPFEVLLVKWIAPASHGRHYAEPNHAGLYRAALCVDDTRASFISMSKDGWTFDRAPICYTLEGTPVPDMWICFLSDPDGIPFEFVERPQSAFRQK